MNMVTFGTNLGPDNIQATMMMDTMGLETTKTMVQVQVQKVTIENLAQETETMVITAVPTLGGNLRIIAAHQATQPQEGTLLQEPLTRSPANALTTQSLDNPSTSLQAPITQGPVYQK